MILTAEENFSDEVTLGRSVNWTNTIKAWILETPAFFPYFRSWFQGKVVADFIANYEALNVGGLVSNNPDALSKTISLIREKDPLYDPIALIDPQSETLYCATAERDKNIIMNCENVPEGIATLLYNRSKKTGGFSMKTGKYNDVLKTLYDPESCAGWLENTIRKHIASGAKVGVPMLPLIVDDESKSRWKEAYVAVKRLVVDVGNIEGEAGIPLALHVPVHRRVFRESNETLSDKSLKLVEKKLADEMKKESKHTELSKICSFCQESLNVANTIRDDIMLDIRKRIQKKTEEQFLTLIEDKEDFTGVEIDDQYNVSVTHKSGYRACTTLSAGQQQVLALSFMAALNVISGFSNPILIDTPLARISNTPQKNIADKLTEYLPDRQIVLLVLPDKEYTEHLRNKIHSRISKEYRIIKDSKGLSQVENYDKKR